MILIDSTERIRYAAALEGEIQMILPFLDRCASLNYKGKIICISASRAAADLILSVGSIRIDDSDRFH